MPLKKFFLASGPFVSIPVQNKAVYANLRSSACMSIVSTVYAYDQIMSKRPPFSARSKTFDECCTGIAKSRVHPIVKDK